jgi:hypothetical protein
MRNLLSPILFISYSRHDYAFVENMVGVLRRHGIRVFLDSSDIDPGDNFVARLSKEIKRATAIVPVISEMYSLSRWAQAELYQALTTDKIAIPVLISHGSISSLDEPLQRLLRDRQYVTITEKLSDQEFIDRLAQLLLAARRRYRYELLRKITPFVSGAALFILAVWWAVANLDNIEQARKRTSAISEVMEAKNVLQHERIVTIASLVAGDRKALGEIILLSQDIDRTDVTRFNALELGTELQKGQKSYRWYVQGLNVERAKLNDVSFVKTSFIGGTWSGLEFSDSVFANAFWAKDKGFSMSGSNFQNVQFLGSEFEAITAINITFVNSKFIGSTIDTSNFSKVRFVTESPQTEGNPIITPYYTSFEKSVLISQRPPPEEGVLDLTMTGDDVVFDAVFFVDSRLEGWFRPEWFRNSNFEHCQLPEGLSKEALESTGNIVD